MRWLLVAIFAYLLVAIQTTLFDTRLLAFQVFGVWIKPDLLLLMALFIALTAEPAEAFIAGWGLGLAEDLTVHLGPLGVAALLFAAAAYLVSLARTVLPARRILAQVLMALGVVFIVRLPHQLLLFWLTDSPAGPLYALIKALGDAGYSALLAPYLFWVLRRTVAASAPPRR